MKPLLFNPWLPSAGRTIVNLKGDWKTRSCAKGSGKGVSFQPDKQEGFDINDDGFVKSPSAVRHAHGPEQSRRAALRFIFSHCGVLVNTPHS